MIFWYRKTIAFRPMLQLNANDGHENSDRRLLIPQTFCEVCNTIYFVPHSTDYVQRMVVGIIVYAFCVQR